MVGNTRLLEKLEVLGSHGVLSCSSGMIDEVDDIHMIQSANRPASNDVLPPLLSSLRITCFQVSQTKLVILATSLTEQ